MQFVAVAIDFHTAELETVELLAIDTGAFLAEVDGAGTGELGDESYYQINERIDGADEETGDGNVHGSLDESFVWIFQWLEMEGDQ